MFDHSRSTGSSVLVCSLFSIEGRGVPRRCLSSALTASATCLCRHNCHWNSMQINVVCWDELVQLARLVVYVRKLHLRKPLKIYLDIFWSDSWNTPENWSIRQLMGVARNKNKRPSKYDAKEMTFSRWHLVEGLLMFIPNTSNPKLQFCFLRRTPTTKRSTHVCLMSFTQWYSNEQHNLTHLIVCFWSRSFPLRMKKDFWKNPAKAFEQEGPMEKAMRAYRKRTGKPMHLAWTFGRIQRHQNTVVSTPNEFNSSLCSVRNCSQNELDFRLVNDIQYMIS